MKRLGAAVVVLVLLGLSAFWLVLPASASSSPSITKVTFTVEPLGGSYACPAPWWASGLASVACGSSGSYVIAAVGQTVSVDLTIANPQPGSLTVEVRRDIIWEPDSTLETFTASLYAASGDQTITVGTFVPDRGTVGPNGFWPLDIGATREYFVRVYWNGQLIYDPTDTAAIYGIGPIPIWATLGRPDVQALCSDGGVANALGWC